MKYHGVFVYLTITYCISQGEKGVLRINTSDIEHRVQSGFQVYVLSVFLSLVKYSQSIS